MQGYLYVIRNYTNFAGRAPRHEFWMFILIHILILSVLLRMDVRLDLNPTGGPLGYLSGIYALATLIPLLAVSARRMHDINKSGWWVLIAFIPLLSFGFLFWAVRDSAYADNQWGRYPKPGRSSLL